MGKLGHRCYQHIQDFDPGKMAVLLSLQSRFPTEQQGGCAHRHGLQSALVNWKSFSVKEIPETGIAFTQTKALRGTTGSKLLQ